MLKGAQRSVENLFLKAAGSILTRVKAVLLDFGDTIATLNPSKEEILGGFLASKGAAVSPAHIRDAYRIVDYCYKQSAVKLKDRQDKKGFLLKINYELLKVLGLSQKSDLWVAELYEHFRERTRWDLFPDVPLALQKISGSGYRMAIIANWDRGLGDLVKSLGIGNYFSDIVCSGELSLEKPAPQIFLHLLKRMDIASDKALYAGNEYETDVVGARNAGLMPVLIDRNNVWPSADCLKFGDLAGLSDYLERT
jgi:putative hydrolase of the HAD superfamily